MQYTPIIIQKRGLCCYKNVCIGKIHKRKNVFFVVLSVVLSVALTLKIAFLRLFFVAIKLTVGRCK